MKHILLVALSLAACTDTATPPSVPTVGRMGPGIVQAEELMVGEVQIVDARDSMSFEEGHLPGALSLDGGDLRGTVDGIDGQALSGAEARPLLEAAGIDPGLPTVVYGDSNDTTTARTLWSLALYGSDAPLQLLDGGLEAWMGAGRSTDTGEADATSTDWTATSMDEDVRVDQAWMLEHLDSDDVTIFDVRSPSEYAAGHIPGAINLEWTQNLDMAGRFIDAMDTLTLHGNPATDVVVVYCQSGARASVSWSLLDFAGLRVRLYDGSWNEWGTDPDTPKVTGSAP